MRTEFLAYAPPCLSDQEREEVLDTLHKDWLSTGPKTKLFEEEFAKYVRAPAALALNSCTAGLHIGLKVLGVGVGDEVITTPMTFCASANVIEHAGARVVLADIDEDTCLISPAEVEKKMSSRTRVLLPVHYGGQPAEMDQLNSLRRESVRVLEDAAHCMPSRLGAKMVGETDNLVAFSFYANKNMTTGEGGMLTGPVELLDRARVMALHGMSRDAWKRFQKGGSWEYDVEVPGFKYNMNDIQASLGLVQLKRLDELYARRMEVVETYEAHFAKHEEIRPVQVRRGVQSSYHLYVIRLNLETLRIDRDQFIVEMAERNIAASVHYKPIHMHSYYANKYGWRPEDFPVAFDNFKRMVSLPISSRYTKEEASEVISVVEDVLKRFRR